MAVRTLQECLDEFVSERPLQLDEYPDVVSGLAYCKRCHSPRRTRQMLFGKERILPIGCRCRMEDAALVQSGSICGPCARWMPTANGRAKRKKNTCAAKPMRNAALQHRSFYRQKRTAGKSSSSTGIQRACRRGLRPHRPPASRGGGAARSSRKRRNLGVKTRCVRVGTARSNCWIGEKRGRMP